jgi:hypothetical protein
VGDYSHLAAMYPTSSIVHARDVRMLGGNAGEQKLSNDPDYKANQQACQRRWCENNPDYWQRYRASHPKYNQRNRELQRLRNQKRRVDASARIAKRYASSDQIDIKSGVYKIIPVDGSSIAKRYALIVKLDVISNNYTHTP